MPLLSEFLALIFLHLSHCWVTSRVARLFEICNCYLFFRCLLLFSVWSLCLTTMPAWKKSSMLASMQVLHPDNDDNTTNNNSNGDSDSNNKDSDISNTVATVTPSLTLPTAPVTTAITSYRLTCWQKDHHCYHCVDHLFNVGDDVNAVGAAVLILPCYCWLRLLLLHLPSLLLLHRIVLNLLMVCGAVMLVLLFLLCCCFSFCCCCGYCWRCQWQQQQQLGILWCGRSGGCICPNIKKQWKMMVLGWFGSLAQVCLIGSRVVRLIAHGTVIGAFRVLWPNNKPASSMEYLFHAGVGSVLLPVKFFHFCLRFWPGAFTLLLSDFSTLRKFVTFWLFDF